VALTRKMIIHLRERDPYCLHCGDDLHLVPHHRRNRGMGGSKSLDRYDNLLMICAAYNGLMESDAKVAEEARDLGHKLGQWQGFDNPVFDSITKEWFVLDKAGNKTPGSPPMYLI
jgi:hypothetical protein